MTDKTLEQVLVKAIEKAEGALDSGIDFAMEQAPEVIQQAMMWNMTLSLITCFFGLFILAVISTWWFFLYKMRSTAVENKKDNWFFSSSGDTTVDSDLPIFYGCMLSFVFVVVGFAILNLTWLKIWIAPKLWLIEYAASLAK